jgi:hypothetical protein
MIRVVHPRSDAEFLHIPDPRVKKGTGSRIRNTGCYLGGDGHDAALLGEDGGGDHLAGHTRLHRALLLHHRIQVSGLGMDNISIKCT